MASADSASLASVTYRTKVSLWSAPKIFAHRCARVGVGPAPDGHWRKHVRIQALDDQKGFRSPNRPSTDGPERQLFELGCYERVTMTIEPAPRSAAADDGMQVRERIQLLYDLAIDDLGLRARLRLRTRDALVVGYLSIRIANSVLADGECA